MKRQQEEQKKQRLEQIKKEAREQAKREIEEEQKKSGGEVWTRAQQQQLEKGMREVPASLPTKERWIKIAESVDGKTPKECFGRFKELCAKAKAGQ